MITAMCVIVVLVILYANHFAEIDQYSFCPFCYKTFIPEYHKDHECFLKPQDKGCES